MSKRGHSVEMARVHLPDHSELMTVNSGYVPYTGVLAAIDSFEQTLDEFVRDTKVQLALLRRSVQNGTF